MRIVFGWNSFKIKTFTPFELGLSKTVDNDFSIELRQSYFHFFWIPFFGIGKKWTIRKDGALYEMPAVYKDHVRTQQLPLKTPWYTFAGPLLIIAGFIFYGFSEKLEDMRHAKYQEGQFEKKTASLNEHFAKTDIHDYYLLQEKSDGAGNKNVLLKVNDIKGNDIAFSTLTTGLEDYDLKPMKICYLFDMKGDGVEKVTINKQKMATALNRKFGDGSKGTDLLGDGRLFIVKEIYHLDGPMLTDRGTGGTTPNSVSMDLINYGWPGTLTKITNLEGSYSWTNELPKEIGSSKNDYDYKGQLHLSGINKTNDDTKYKVELTMVDSLQKEHKYLVEGQQLDKTVRQLY
jgi:hypothetical protein